METSHTNKPFNRVGDPESPEHIPNYIVAGQPNRPDILSNKIILTPVAPGNQRGSIWGERQLTRKEWTADVDFRASGPEHASGNLNIWLAKDGRSMIGANSVYTIGKFEGLVLVIDQHGNTGGMLRGFLNDGSIDYSRSQSVDSLAFGNCFFSYRNLGRPAQVKFSQSSQGLKVEVDGKRCFESDKIGIPEGYTFGITAATPENPDSFEIFKMAVLSDEVDPRHKQEQQQQHNQQGQSENNQQQHYGSLHQQPPTSNANNHESRSQQPPEGADDAFKNVIPDANPDVFQTSKTQFQDLHNRLQSTMHQLSAIYRTVNSHQERTEGLHTDLRDLLHTLRTDMDSKMERIDAIDRNIRDLQHNFNQMRDDLISRIQNNDNSVRGYLTDHHRTLSQTVSQTASDNVPPGHGRLIFIILGSQVVLVFGYIVYKRRKGNFPKKYL